MKIKTGLGEDSHKIINTDKKELILAGVKFDEEYALEGNSDADVVLHSITNAISSITGQMILGKIADNMVSHNIKSSEIYLNKALSYLNQNQTIEFISISIEAKKPNLALYISKMKKKIAQLTYLQVDDVGITVHSGEELSSFGKGEGIKATALVTIKQE